MPRNERLRQMRLERRWRQQDVADQLGVALVTIQRWERGFQQPSAYYRLKLSALFALSAQELGLLEAPPSPEPAESGAKETASPSVAPSGEIAIWTVPYARNPHFTGREDLLSELMQQFSPQSGEQPLSLRRAALTQAYAVKGLGGVGKTQIALEYAYRGYEQGRYTHTIWLNAASEEAILTSFVALAEFLPALAPVSETDQRKQVAAIIRWLEACAQPWLLIVDNADELSFLPSYLPVRGNGHILLTTRVSAVGALAPSIEVDCMSLMEGTQLLLRRAQREGSATDAEMDKATTIVMALAQFPLALDQAGAYIEETGCSLHDYFQLYQQHRYALLARRGKQATHYPESVATTWSLSFQHVAQTNPAAAELLQLCAYLSPDHIPEELLIEGTPHWPATLQQAAVDLLAFNRMLETLLAFSLVKRLAEHRLLSIHRLVQVVQRERLTPEEQRRWAERLVRALNLLFPHDPREVGSWPQCQRYLEQVQACDLLLQEQHLLLPEAAELFDRAGTYLREGALYSLAEPLYQRALTMREQLVGEAHPDIAHSLNNLAVLSYKQGQQAQAEALFLRALQIREQSLGAEHPELAPTLTCLAILYEDQGKHAQAEVLFLRALRIQERQLGPEHPARVATLTALAFFSFERGKYAQAEALYQRVLHIQEQQLGPEHPELAATLTGLAYVYSRQGKYREVESLYQRALHIQEQQLGVEHHAVAETLIGLANLYRDLGRDAQAEPLYQRALHIQEQQLGPEHPQLARILYGLAAFSFKQKKYAQAEQLHQRVLRLLEPVLGAENYNLAYSLSGLADMYRVQGKETQAESLYRRALRLREQQLGPEHPDVATPLHGLALLYSRQGKERQAEAFYQRALHIREQQLGPESIETADVLHDFAGLQQAQGRTREAAVLYQRALVIREHALGVDFLATTDTRERLHEVLDALGRMQETVRTEG